MPFLQWVKNGFCIGFQLMEQCNCTVSFIFRGGDDSAQQSGVGVRVVQEKLKDGLEQGRVITDAAHGNVFNQRLMIVRVTSFDSRSSQPSPSFVKIHFNFQIWYWHN